MIENKCLNDTVNGLLSSLGVFLGAKTENKNIAPRLEFWGVYPLACSCNMSLARIAWSLDDAETSQWVTDNVLRHVCHQESTIQGEIVQASVNGVPTHNMTWICEAEYNRLVENLKGRS